MRSSFDYSNFDVYRKAQLFNLKVRPILGMINTEDKYKIDQLKKASFSIMLNIAEGNARMSPRDRSNFFVIARSSAIECAAIIEYLELAEEITTDNALPLLEVLSEISKMLYPLTQVHK